MTKSIKLDLAKIRIDGGTQSRVQIDQRTVDEYADSLDNGDTFPPLDVFHDGTDYWLADGFHRLEAFKARHRKKCDVIVHQGGQRAAILWSVAANGKHGLRRSNDDKRRAVMTLVQDPEWSQWSNREISRRCAVDEGTVRKYREESGAEIPHLVKGGDGKTYPVRQPENVTEDYTAPSFLSSLDDWKWYPVNPLTKSILFDAFDSAEALRADDRYKLAHVATYGHMLKHHVQYSSYKIIPHLPLATTAPSPKSEIPAPSAPARTYPTGARGNMIDDKYYPVINRRGDVHDEAFDDHDACLKCPRYPGNKPVLGRSINHLPFYATFRLVAPVAKVVVQDAPASEPASVQASPTQPPAAEHMIYQPADRFTADLPGSEEAFERAADYWGHIAREGKLPASTEPTCRMIFSLNEWLGDEIPTAQEQFLLDIDYWSELARMGELPASTEPTRLPFADDRFYPVDDKAKHVYHDPRLVAETIHSPYRAVSGRDLNLAPAFQAYQRIDCDLPARIVPASARPTKRVEDDKFYICDRAASTISARAYQTLHDAHLNISSPFLYVETGENINNLIRYERWKIVEPAQKPNGNGNGNGSKPWESISNRGKDTTKAGWESQAVANHTGWMNALDFRILVEANHVDIDEATLKQIARPLKQLVIDAIKLGKGEIDRKAFGEAAGVYVTAVSERPVKVAPMGTSVAH